MRIVVTGASGFVGRATCVRLTEAGHQVTAVVRATGPKFDINAVRVVRIGNISAQTDWSDALAGADAVVHLAAKIADGKRTTPSIESAFWQTNVEGTRDLAEAALRAAALRFVFVSSIKVNGESTGAEPFTSSMKSAPMDLYGRTKAAAEKVLFELAPRGMEIVVLRPPVLYGPGVKGNLARLFGIAERGIPVPFGSINNARDMLSVRSFADLVARAISHPSASGRVFVARDGTPVSTPGLFRAIARSLNKQARIFPVPVPILRWAGKAMGQSGEIDRLISNLEIDDRATREILDWTPSSSMEKTLEETARWWRNKARSEQ
jgi:nucleoside-diphosphate-sugar epimerase